MKYKSFSIACTHSSGHSQIRARKNWAGTRTAAATALRILCGGLSGASLVVAFTSISVSAQTAAASAAGTLSAIRGKVEIKSSTDKAPRAASAAGASLRGGDIILVGADGQATLLLSATRQSYEIAADSQVRITDDGKAIRPISGPLPRRVAASQGSGSVGTSQAALNEQRSRRNTLASLLDNRLQASVTRGGFLSPVYAPIDITPLFGIAASPSEAITLKWGGPGDPAAATSASFHIRVFDRDTGAAVFTSVRPVNARDVVLPPGTLTVGVWYKVSIGLVDDSPSGAMNHKATGWVRLLTADESAALQKSLHEADQDPAHADLVRARAYETAGMTTQAITSYESALRSGQLPQETARDVNNDLAFLYRIVADTTTVK